jgi:hypothetical protein
LKQLLSQLVLSLSFGWRFVRAWQTEDAPPSEGNMLLTFTECLPLTFHTEFLAK